MSLKSLGASSVQTTARRIFSFVFLLFFFLSFASIASAIEYGGFGGRPANPRTDNPRTESIFIHTLEPGESKQDGVIVVNNTPETKTLLVYAADSTPSTGGAFACEQFSEEKTSVGAWITLSASEVTLESGTSQTVPFTIRVPSKAGVGEHNGCILIQEKKAKQADQTGVSLSVRTGLRVAITVPGDIVRKIDITGFTVDKDKGKFILHPEVKNTGNVSIDADVQVVTKSILGLTIMEHGGQFPILKGESSDWRFELPKPFWGGFYRSSFSLEYDQNPEASVGLQSGKDLTRLKGPSAWFFSFPKPLALVIELIVLAALLYLFYRYKNLKRHLFNVKNNWQEYKVRRGDTINSLALAHNLPWQTIAKANKLKPPYTLTAGETIKVPPEEIN